jgi:hypothetical protein
MFDKEFGLIDCKPQEPIKENYIFNKDLKKIHSG